MRIRSVMLSILSLFLFFGLRAAHAEALCFALAPDVIRPGKNYDITVYAPCDGSASLSLLDENEDDVVCDILSGYPLQEGENLLIWNGLGQEDTIFPSGEYIFRLTTDSGAQADRSLRIGAPYPIISQFFQSDFSLIDTPVSVSFLGSEPCLLIVTLHSAADEAVFDLDEMPAIEGFNHYAWDGTLGGTRVPDGAYTLAFTLQTDSGFKSISHYASIDVMTLAANGDPPGSAPNEIAAPVDEPATLSQAFTDVVDSYEFTDLSDAYGDTNMDLPEAQPADEEPLYAPANVPADDGTDIVNVIIDSIIVDPTQNEANSFSMPQSPMLSLSPPYSSVWDESYWSMTPGELDDAVIWEILMQPITVYDGGIKAGTKGHAYLMENPDGTGKQVAQLHTQSQGVHVIGETNEFGYVLVEAFSNYDREFYPETDEEKAHAFEIKHGYVLAKNLKTVNVMPDIALLIDKLTQRLYIFIDGKRVTELLISTGTWSNSNDMLFETIPGEFITVSHDGGFWSGNMYCDMSIRINGGVLLHEVPCKKNADGTKNFSSFEGYLGTKQSHGCVRIQRLKNADGFNHSWLWSNLQKYKPYKVMIWDDLNRLDSPSTWYPNPSN
ncbi:MAG: L,D-transpeptidase family protein [Firmicutes bacterium]|nr:L,D-transpeptidase family protein [Bacillota bacterium]